MVAETQRLELLEGAELPQRHGRVVAHAVADNDLANALDVRRQVVDAEDGQHAVHDGVRAVPRLLRLAWIAPHLLLRGVSFNGTQWHRCGQSVP